MNRKLFLTALLFSMIFVSSECQAKESSDADDAQKSSKASDASSTASSNSASQAVGKKFKKLEFAKDNFAILLPSDYYTAEKGTDVRTYTSSDYPHGLITVMCATAPEHSSFSPPVLKQLVEKLTPNKKSTDKEEPIKVNGVQGTEWQFTNSGDAPQNGCRVRGFINGRKMYIIMVYGTKPWVGSAAINEFMNSFEIKQ